MDPNADAAVDAVAALLANSKRTLVFTGAGISTESGIPDFRGPQGLWTKVDPALFTIQNYVADRDIRIASWRQRLDSGMWEAEPNAGHRAITDLEHLGVAPVVVTQNVDGLHQRAGSTDVVELHGTVREVSCLDCGEGGPVEPVLERIRAGDEDPECRSCGGILKVTTISFGQSLDQETIERAFDEARRADVCLAVGSTLSVTPAAYIPMETAERGGRLIIVSRSPTELDSMASAILTGSSGTVLPILVERVRALES